METALVPILVAVVAALGTYVVAVRRFSGKVGSSEAAELWKESASLREWTSKRMREQDELIDKLRARLADLEKRNDTLAVAKRALERRVEACEKLGDEIEALTGQLATANRRLAELGGQSA